MTFNMILDFDRLFLQSDIFCNNLMLSLDSFVRSQHRRQECHLITSNKVRFNFEDCRQNEEAFTSANPIYSTVIALRMLSLRPQVTSRNGSRKRR